MSGDVEEIWDEVDEEGIPSLMFQAHELSCEACSLELEGTEQLSVPGVSAVWEDIEVGKEKWVENYDPSNYM